MNKEDLNQLLKEHYETRGLSHFRVTRILAGCDIARAVYRWRLRAIGAISLATTAMIALAMVIYGIRTPEPVVEAVAQTSLPQPHKDHKLVAVMIHATNCPNSKAMAPIFTELQKIFVDESVLFIKFDYSSDGAKHQAELLSKDLGLGGIFEHYKKTGDIILVSSRGEVRDVMDRSVSIASATTTLRENVDLAR